PGKVTLFGVSAGAANILSLMISPLSQGLFHGAISESAPIYSYSMTQAEAAEEQGGLASSSAEVLLRLLVAAKRAPDRNAATAPARSMSATETPAFLRAHPAPALLTATLMARPTGDDRPPEFATVLRDGAVIPDEPLPARFQHGAYHRVPLVIGT